MVTVPGRGATVQAARGFYRDHLGIIVVAQVMGLIAAAAFVLFAVGLQRQDRGRPLLRYAGVAVAAASVVTAVPVLWLCMPASTVTPAMLTGLLVASDIADVVLFLAIAGFATAIAIAARAQWTKALALAVAHIDCPRGPAGHRFWTAGGSRAGRLPCTRIGSQRRHTDRPAFTRGRQREA
jgi:hypothetical protein